MPHASLCATSPHNSLSALSPPRQEGEAAKKVVDQIIDAASDLINLRIAIMK